MTVRENSHRAPESGAKATAVQTLRVCNVASNLAERLDFRLRQTTARQVGAFTAALAERVASHPSPSTIHYPLF